MVTEARLRAAASVSRGDFRFAKLAAVDVRGQRKLSLTARFAAPIRSAFLDDDLVRPHVAQSDFKIATGKILNRIRIVLEIILQSQTC